MMHRGAGSLNDLWIAAAASEQDDQLQRGAAVQRGMESVGAAHPFGLGNGHTSEIKVVEVDAFASVHDMIHAAINTYGPQATLREIYRACEQRGRIAYKRSGGSRLITHNDHWKSQIRHALYTCDRFQRALDDADSWTVSPAFAKVTPQTTKVLIRSDSDAGSINEELLEGKKGGRASRRLTRSKHALDIPVPNMSPRKKRSRSTRIPAKFENRDGFFPEVSHLSDSMAASAPGDHQMAFGHAPFRAGAEMHTAGSGYFGLSDEGVEGEEANSHTHFARRQRRGTGQAAAPYKNLACGESGALERAYARGLRLDDDGGDAAVKTRAQQRMQERQWAGYASEEVSEKLADSAAPGQQSASAEAESPPVNQQTYSLRPRGGGCGLGGPSRASPPGFGSEPSLEAAEAAERAASATQGPIKKRLKAAAKAAAAAEAAAAAAAAASGQQPDVSSTHSGGLWAPSGSGAAPPHAAASPASVTVMPAPPSRDLSRNRRKPLRGGSPSPTAAGGPAGSDDPQPHSTSAASAQGTRRGPRPRPRMLPASHISSLGPPGGSLSLSLSLSRGTSHQLLPPTPSAAAPALVLGSCTTTPGTTPSPNPPRAILSALQGAASSVGPGKPAPESAAGGYASEDSDGGGGLRGRILRSHTAAVGSLAGTGGAGRFAGGGVAGMFQ